MGEVSGIGREGAGFKDGGSLNLAGLQQVDQFFEGQGD